MSHQSQIQCKIRSIDALKSACAAMGLKFLDQKAYRGYGSQTYQCSYAIKLKDGYDVGVVQESDGTHSLRTDFWGGNTSREIGQNGGMLLQEYGAQAAIESAQMHGMSVYRTNDEVTGEIVIEMYEQEEM